MISYRLALEKKDFITNKGNQITSIYTTFFQIKKYGFHFFKLFSDVLTVITEYVYQHLDNNWAVQRRLTGFCKLTRPMVYTAE